MFLPTDTNKTQGSTAASILQHFILVIAHSITSTSPSPRDRYRRDNGDGGLGPGEIMSFVGALLGFIVGIPSLIMVSIQVRKYWRRRIRKEVIIDYYNN